MCGLFVLGEELQLHTAHEFKTANEHFLRVAGLVEGSPDLRRKVARIRYANGEQGIELKSGARLKFMARSGGSGRGFAGASTVYLDEAMYLTAAMLGAILPTLSTHWNPQVIYTGSGGFASSDQLWSLRKRALSGDGGRLAYLEHTAESVRLDASGEVVSNRDMIDPADRELWAMANPAMVAGRISVEAVEAQFRAMPPAEFLRERLTVWEPEPRKLGARLIPEADWLANVTDEPAGVPVAFGVDVTPDRSTAAIGAVSVGAVPHVGVVDHRPGKGVGWLADRVAEIRAQHPEAMWVVDGRSQANGLVADPVTVLNAREMAQACGALFSAVSERAVRYRRSSVLESAVEAAAARPLGDAWAWDRRNASGDISPLVAVTLALFGASVQRDAGPPVFAY